MRSPAFFFLKDWLSAPHPPWSLSQVLEECPPTSIWDRASGHRVWAGLPLCLEVVFLLGFLCLIKWRFSFKLANWVSESLFHEMCHQKKKKSRRKENQLQMNRIPKPILFSVNIWALGTIYFSQNSVLDLIQMYIQCMNQSPYSLMLT